MRQKPPRAPFFLSEYADSLPGALPPKASHLWVWTSDWHVVSDDAETGIVGETHPTDAAALAAHIVALAPAGVIDTGDCKDHFGAGATDEHTNYVASVRATLPYAAVVAGTGTALLPILPGNHDERNDYTNAAGTDWQDFDSAFWPAPYHFACDWPVARVRFLCFHTEIVHAPSALQGFASVSTGERSWLTTQLAALPTGYRAIVCSHFPAHPTFGNYLHATLGGTELQALLAANTSRVACYLNGHRHGNMETASLAGIPHINGPGVAYTIGNGRGGFCPIAYDDVADAISFDFRQGPPSAYPRMPAYNPLVVSLPASTQ